MFCQTLFKNYIFFCVTSLHKTKHLLGSDVIIRIEFLSENNQILSVVLVGSGVRPRQHNVCTIKIQTTGLKQLALNLTAYKKVSPPQHKEPNS